MPTIYVRSNNLNPSVVEWGLALLPLPASAGPVAVLVCDNSDGTSTVYSGTDLQTDASGAVVGGVVTLVQRFSLAGGAGAILESISGLSVALSTIVANYGSFSSFLLAGADSIVGGTLDDALNGHAGNDTITGGDGNDTLVGGTGADSLLGGNGTDYASYAGAASAVTVDFVTPAGNSGDAAGDSHSLIEGIIGSAFNDALRGNGSNNTLIGGAGNDSLTGRDGSDFIDGGAGTGDEARYDTSSTSPITTPGYVVANLATGIAVDPTGGGTDTLVNIEGLRGTNFASHGDQLTGNAFDNFFRGLRGADTLDGGAGNDEARYNSDANYSGGTSAVNVNLVTGFATDGFGTVDTLISIEAARGTNNLVTGDTLIGGNVANGVYSNEGFEGFRGLAGNDTINGGGGYDEVRYDQDVSYTGGTGAVTVNLVTGFATDGFGNTDTLLDIEGARGTNFADSFIGNALQNQFFGLDGVDTFVLGDGFDYVEPGAGNDYVDGTPGALLDQSYDDRDMVSYDDFGASGVGVYIDLDLNTFVDPTGGIDTIIDIERLRGTSASDVFLGSNTKNLRDEMYQGLAGDDIIDGRAGYDIADYSRDAKYGGNLGIVADLAAGTIVDGFGDTDRVYYVESVRGTNSNDHFIGDGGRNQFRLFDGVDTVEGGAGKDVVDMYVDDVVPIFGVGAVVDLAAGTATSIYLQTSTLTGIEDVQGSSGHDLITGSAEGNAINGWLGNDTIDGGAGNDIINGSAGANVMAGGADFDIAGFLYDPTFYTYLHNIYGSLYATAWAGVTVDLGAGTYTNFDGAAGTLTGFEGVVGTFANDDITGHTGDNLFYGLSGNDTIDGGGGIDTVSYAVWNSDGRVFAPIAGINASIPNGITVNLDTGLASDGEGGFDLLIDIDNIVGSIGNDLITGNAGDNVINGGEGVNTFVFSGAMGAYTTTSNAFGAVLTGNYTVSAIAGGYIVVGADGTDTLLSINKLQFSDQTIDVAIPGAVVDNSASTAPVEATGGQGDDTIVGGSAGDALFGGTGGDSLAGGEGGDELNAGSGNDNVDGGVGNDTLVGGSGEGDDTYTGGAGIDEVKYTSTSLGIVVDLSAGIASGNEIGIDTLIEIENVIGGSGADWIYGDWNANELLGEAGADTIIGGGGNDTLRGGAGNDHLSVYASTEAALLYGDSDDDTLLGGYGNDTLDGGANSLNGGDTAYLFQATSDLTLTLDSSGGAVVSATGIGTDTLINIENVIGGSGNDHFTGNDGVNRLTGDGNDSLTGAGAADVFVRNSDTMATQTDTVTDFSIADGDQIAFGENGPASWGVLNNHLLRQNGANVELQGLWNGTAQTMVLNNLTIADIVAANGPLGAPNFNFDISGAQRYITGTALSDKIFGGLGGDSLAGGGDFDTIAGDAGDDTIDGGTGNDSLFGGAGDDGITGGDGNDRLYGEAGIDTLGGGAGNDTYYVADAGDVVIDGVGGGSDTVQTTVDWTMTAGAEIEYAHVNTASGRSLTGNELGNWLQGNAGADTLGGGGGNDLLDGSTGADSMSGGEGDDTFYVDNFGDAVGEAASQGADTVLASADWVATAGAHVEVIRARTAGLSVTGNELANTMYGTSGADTLGGGGGNDRFYGILGADSLAGGGGNDAFYINDGAASVYEALGGGSDAVQVSVDWTLTAGQEIEYVHVNTGFGRSLTGNDLANWLDGNVGDDTLDGGLGNDDLYGGVGLDRLLGGGGNDRMSGGGGADTFVFGDVWGRDFVTDFQHGVDKLDLSGVTGLDNFGQLTVSLLGADVLLTYAGQSIRVRGDATIGNIEGDIIF